MSKFKSKTQKSIDDLVCQVNDLAKRLEAEITLRQELQTQVNELTSDNVPEEAEPFVVDPIPASGQVWVYNDPMAEVFSDVHIITDPDQFGYFCCITTNTSGKLGCAIYTESSLIGFTFKEYRSYNVNVSYVPPVLQAVNDAFTGDHTTETTEYVMNTTLANLIKLGIIERYTKEHSPDLRICDGILECGCKPPRHSYRLVESHRIAMEEADEEYRIIS